MRACAVESQKPRLPTSIHSACGAISRSAGSIERVVQHHASRCASARAPRRVIRSAEPGPAPTMVTRVMVEKVYSVVSMDRGSTGARAGHRSSWARNEGPPADDHAVEGGSAAFVACKPHSFAASSSHHQRPARKSSPTAMARVHGAQPMLGMKASCSGL